MAYGSYAPVTITSPLARSKTGDFGRMSVSSIELLSRSATRHIELLFFRPPRLHRKSCFCIVVNTTRPTGTHEQHPETGHDPWRPQPERRRWKDHAQPQYRRASRHAGTPRPRGRTADPQGSALTWSTMRERPPPLPGRRHGEAVAPPRPARHRRRLRPDRDRWRAAGVNDLGAGGDPRLRPRADSGAAVALRRLGGR